MHKYCCITLFKVEFLSLAFDCTIKLILNGRKVKPEAFRYLVELHIAYEMEIENFSRNGVVVGYVVENLLGYELVTEYVLQAALFLRHTGFDFHHLFLGEIGEGRSVAVFLHKAEIVLAFKLSDIYNEGFGILDIVIPLFCDALIKTGVNVLNYILRFLNTAAFTYDVTGNGRKGFAINAVEIGFKRINAQKRFTSLYRLHLSSSRFSLKSFKFSQKSYR